jgi:type IV pilus assembly protein PilV
MDMIRNDQGGFSLLEGLIAMALIVTGLLTMTAMQGISLSYSVDANDLTKATNLAAEMMERVQFNRKNVLAYNALDTAVGCMGISASLQPMARGDCEQWAALLTSGGVGSGLRNVSGQVAVQPVGPTTPPLNQSRVTVTVRWISQKGEGKSSRPRQIAIAMVMSPE